MTDKNLLLCLVLLVVARLADSRHASLCKHKVPPDNWAQIPSHKRQNSDYTDYETNFEDYNLCETQECQKIATELLNSMNKSADPCEDFYEYTCGGWTTNIAFPPSFTFWNHDTMYQNIVHFRLKKLLEVDVISNEILPVKQAKKWYHSCMDTETLAKRKLRPIESIVMQAGGWPMSMEDEEWDADGHPWQSVDGHYARLTGSHAFYHVDVNPIAPVVEDDIPEIRIGPPKLLQSRESLTFHKSYKKGLLEKVVDEFRLHNGASSPGKSYKTEIDDLIKFEKSILTVIANSGDMSGNEYTDRHDTNMTLDEFADWYQNYTIELNEDPKSTIDWISTVQSLFDIANIRIDPDAPVFVNNLEYIKGIGELLKETPERTIVNFVHWNFIASMLTYTSDSMRDYIFKLRYENLGAKHSEPRWLECILQMKMRNAAAYVFANKYFSKPIESAARELLKNVQHALNENIDKSNWLDADSKAFAKDKVTNMKIFMGIPDWYTNETAVINYYKGVIMRDDYFDNTLSYMKFEVKQNLKLFVNPQPRVDLTTWIADAISVNAEYGTGNSLNLPPVNFQPPIFTSGFPDYVNYGLAGFTIGHEMGHSFDHRGIKFGKDHNDTQLSEDILNSYYQRADCFVRQYEGYFNESETDSSESNSVETRGWITRGENIADTTGLQAVFHAYGKLNKKKPNGDTKLPRMEEFSDEQLFFIAYASAWCGVERPEYSRFKDESNELHSPGRFRVIGAVSNTKDFAKVFNCPKGSSMNPLDKCSIWKKPGAKQGASRKCSHKHG